MSDKEEQKGEETMTGAYVRIKRDGKFQPIEIDQLTEAEIREFLKGRDHEFVQKWVIFLVDWIQRCVGEEAV
jgi:hypothetical protein